MKLLTLKIFIALLLIFSLMEFEAQELSGSRTIYLIRHGEYNSEDERDPDVGKELVSLGIAQTRLLSSRLRTQSPG